MKMRNATTAAALVSTAAIVLATAAPGLAVAAEEGDGRTDVSEVRGNWETRSGKVDLLLDNAGGVTKGYVYRALRDGSSVGSRVVAVQKHGRVAILHLYAAERTDTARLKDYRPGDVLFTLTGDGDELTVTNKRWRNGGLPTGTRLQNYDG